MRVQRLELLKKSTCRGFCILALWKSYQLSFFLGGGRQIGHLFEHFSGGFGANSVEDTKAKSSLFMIQTHRDNKDLYMIALVSV